jgi:hypothetical protein
MEVRFALIADAANISREGKLNILGEFNAVHAAQYPYRHPVICYIASIEIINEDRGHRFEIELRYTDEDGRAIAPPIAFQIGVAGPDVPGGIESHSLILPINNLTVPRTGKYCFDLWCDGVMVKRTRLTAFTRILPTGP